MLILLIRVFGWIQERVEKLGRSSRISMFPKKHMLEMGWKAEKVNSVLRSIVEGEEGREGRLRGAGSNLAAVGIAGCM